MPIYRNVKEDFFDTWSPAMAYVPGFIFADGYVHSNKRGSRYLGLVSTDIEIIQKIRRVLDSDHKIHTRMSSNPKHKILYRLQIGNTHIINTLKKYGITQNKSLVIKLPKDIPQDVVGHFVRGYFDGDGCIYFSERTFKDRKNPRLVLTSQFTSGSKSFLVGLKRKIGTHMRGGTIRARKTRAFDLVFGREDSLALYRLVYSDITNGLFLSRKYEKFNHAIKTIKETHQAIPFEI